MASISISRPFGGEQREVRPVLIIVGTFIYLFPTPLAEIRQVADSVGAKVMYDGAHVLGLIAGRHFQDPLSEGADILVGSTQKTLPGPTGGVIACNDKEIIEKVLSVTNALFASYGNSRIAALGMTAAEMLHFGREYASAIFRNARALAETLDAEGFHVLGKPLGYTASHQIIFDAAPWGGGKQVMEVLEGANIHCSYFALTSDYPHSIDKGNGVRFGVSVVTRLGMREKQMKEIGGLIRKALCDPKQKDRVKGEVGDLATQFKRVQYSFDSSEPAS